MSHILFFINPHAGKGDVRTHCLEIVEIFKNNGFTVTLHPTAHRGEIAEQLPLLAPAYDLVVSCGGDGTLNETISGLMEMPANIRPTLGYLPAGTVNDFASSLGISKLLPVAAQTIAQGKPFSCDIGQFNARYFSYVAAFGAFTDVSYETPQESKNLLGRSAYILEGVKRLPQVKPYHMRLEHDNGVAEGEYLFGMISNATSVAGISLRDVENISMSDGLLEVTLLQNPESFVEAQQMMSAVLWGDHGARQITFRTTHLTVHSPDRAPWALDGEFGGNPEDIEVINHRHALRILI